MSPIVISSLGLGLNLHDPATEIADGQMAGASNVVFTRGVLRTPHGFARLGAGSLPLGAPILNLCHYREQSGSPTDHIVAMTRSGFALRNAVLDSWTSLGPDTALLAGADNVPSFVGFPHTDAIKADGAGIDCNYHLLACDGGNSPIHRWAGKFEGKFYPLQGADGYHEASADPATPTVHYCQQVSAFYNHVILVSPKTWQAASNAYIENPQTIFWGKAGLLETDPDNPGGKGAFDLTESGAGFVALMDTGDKNVRVELMDDLLIVYQTHSIWYMYHVGGDDVFLAKCQNPNLGLLAPGLLVAWRNQHFLVGHDFKPYSYAGGSSFQPIGASVFEALKEDMDPTKLNRCRMAVGENGDRLWILIVRRDYEYPTRAYLIDTLTGAWMVRDFEHVYEAGGGVTAITLAGGQRYTVGRTYQQDIDTGATYQDAIDEGRTYDQLLTVVLLDEALLLGDSESNIYAFDPDLSTDDGVSIPCHADTKVFDWGRPDQLKGWSTLNVTAKGGAMQVSYRIDYFDTQDEGWTAFEATTLTDGYATCEFGLEDIASEAIQFRIANDAGSGLAVKKLILGEPSLQESY